MGDGGTEATGESAVFIHCRLWRRRHTGVRGAKPPAWVVTPSGTDRGNRQPGKGDGWVSGGVGAVGHMGQGREARCAGRPLHEGGLRAKPTVARR